MRDFIGTYCGPFDVFGICCARDVCDLAFSLTFALSGTLDPAGDTLTYPCISWCSAEQKSVQ
jgi:hypothetical protein